VNNKLESTGSRWALAQFKALFWHCLQGLGISRKPQSRNT